MAGGLGLGVGPDLFGQLAATDPYARRARRLFERGQVTVVEGNEAEVRVSADAQGNPLTLRGVPIISGYAPRVGDWVAIQYEGGHSGAPWVVGPSMAGDAASDPAGVGVFPVSAGPPDNPQQSTIYFDETLGAWRGWDGAAWVDFFAKLHNTLPDLQGGYASEYYHFSQAAHEELARWLGAAGFAGGMTEGHAKQLSFHAIDASATERTRLFEKDGDFYWAVNAEYDAAGDRWDRIDTSKQSYLIGLYSKNGIPHEPGTLGGVAWWRAVEGPNPVADYTAVGGWELGFMMTQHRNFVLGGMNCEIDGAGSPPYGRFSQSGHEDPDNFTAILRNIWYEGNTRHSPKVAGEGSWGRDTTDHPGWFQGIVDDIGFVWRYKAAGEGAFATSDWMEVARLDALGALTLAGGATISGSLLFATATGHRGVYLDTVDGADNRKLELVAASAASGARGAYVQMTGNEYGAVRNGYLALVAGQPGTTGLEDGYISFHPNTAHAWDMTRDGDFVPYTDSTFDIGSSAKYVANLFADRVYLRSNAYADGSNDGDFTISGNLRVGTYAAKGAEAFAGYITIKDAAGNSRKVMVCA